MRKLHLLILLLLFFTNTAYSEKVDIYKRPEKFERSRDYDALHYKLSFNIDLKNKTYKAENTITLLPLKDNFRESA